MKRFTITILIVGLAVTNAWAQSDSHPEAQPAPEVDAHRKVVREIVIDRGDGPRLLKVQRGYFGISTLDMTSDLLRHFDVDSDAGVLIASVADDGPADVAGIRVGDVLVEVDGESIESQVDTAMVIGRLEPGTTVYAKVFRDGRQQTLEVKVGESERGQLPINWVVEPMHEYAGAPGVYQYRFKTGPGDEEVMVFNTEPMREAAERLHERFNSPEFRARIEAFSARNSELEVRLQDMEKRLEEMGERLTEALAQLQRQALDD